MNLNEKPRVFYPRGDEKICISDFGEIHLMPDEQITFVKPSGARYDFASKDWGYYATPSINNRLTKENFKTALVKIVLGTIILWLLRKQTRLIF